MTDDGSNAIFTVGHSDHDIQRFIELLVGHRITAVADVRSMPYSKFTPQFNREQLEGRAGGCAYPPCFSRQRVGSASRRT